MNRAQAQAIRELIREEIWSAVIQLDLPETIIINWLESGEDYQHLLSLCEEDSDGNIL